jgi:hypothetical protein
MRLASFIEYLRKHLRLLVKLSFVVLALLIVADAIPAIVHKEGHAHTTLEKLPGFWSVFGFVGCVLIILVSKWYGHAGIMKKEDYYDE